MFGKGIRYWICKIPFDEFLIIHKIREKLGIDYENIFFDLEILEEIGYTNWENIHCIYKGRGFFIKSRNRIEIKRKSKLLKRFDSSELLYSPLLIEQYKVIYDDFIQSRSEEHVLIALIQHETGSFFKFKCIEEKFDVNKLVFVLNYDKLNQSIGEQFISNLIYDGSILPTTDEDVVCTGNQVIIL